MLKENRRGCKISPNIEQRIKYTTLHEVKRANCMGSVCLYLPKCYENLT